jgi:hypothetical protein
LDDLNNQISVLNGKITDEQTRLSVYTGAATPVTVSAVTPAITPVADTTHP